jgi:hypothetical protein
MSLMGNAPVRTPYPGSHVRADEGSERRISSTRLPQRERLLTGLIRLNESFAGGQDVIFRFFTQFTLGLVIPILVLLDSRASVTSFSGIPSTRAFFLASYLEADGGSTTPQKSSVLSTLPKVEFSNGSLARANSGMAIATPTQIIGMIFIVESYLTLN